MKPLSWMANPTRESTSKQCSYQLNRSGRVFGSGSLCFATSWARSVALTTSPRCSGLAAVPIDIPRCVKTSRHSHVRTS